MTADTYSTDGIGVLLMGTGNDNNIWGANANTSVFQIFADAIANALSSAVTGGTLDLSGSPPPAAPSQTRYAALIFTGVLASNQTVQVPNLKKWWMVKNATSGAFTLKFKTPSGSASTAIPQNSGWQLVYCDGADAIVVSPFNFKQIQMPDGSVSAPPFSNINETNSGWYRAGTQDWRLTINGVDVLQVTGTGAGTPSIVNVLSPNALQIAGVAVQAGQAVPAGTVSPYAGASAPTGWLLCNGAAVSRTTFAALFAIIGVTYGAGDLSTTFNVPDLGGRVVAGKEAVATRLTTAGCGIDGATLGAAGGAQTVTLSTAQIPTGLFTFNDASHTHLIANTDTGNNAGSLTLTSSNFLTGKNATAADAWNYLLNGDATSPTIGKTSSTATGASITDHAGGQAHTNAQPTMVLNYIIKT